MTFVHSKLVSKLALVFIGCVGFLAAPLFQSAMAQSRVQAASNVEVNLADKSLERSIEVDRASFALRGPVTQVQVTLSNTKKSSVNLQYRAQWLGADGFEIVTKDRWEQATIDGNTSRSIDIVGNTREAVSVVVNFKAQ